MTQNGSSSFIDHQAHSPIESLLLDKNYSKMCFTHFSHLNEWYRNKNIDIISLHFYLVHDQTDFPLGKLKSLYALP